MLVNLCDYKQSVTLIANSGVQFLDFGLTPQESAHYGRFVRKTANGPLLRLDFDLTSGRYTLPGRAGGQPEVVKPESTQTLHYSLDVLDGIWLPLPFLRFNPPRTFIDGPDNWARIQVRKLSEPDSAGNTHRITLAFDSQLAKNMPAALAPCENDLLNGTRFALAWRDEEVADFLDQTWIDGWLRESFLQYASQVENRPEQAIQQALRSFEYQAHWLNLLTLLGEQLTVPEVKFVTHTLSTPAIPVDLILDVGNTHTCGVLIEDHGDANDGLRQTAELQVRSLSEPQYLNDPLFTSRVEFSDDGVGANVKITPHLLFREGFKVAGDDLLLDIIQRCVLPSLQTALQRAGVTDAAALLATLFGDSGRIDTQAILRQQTALQLFMPLGHAVLSAWEQSDINDPFAGLHATFGDLLIRRPTSNVMNYIQQAIDHALPSGSPTFDIFNVPLQIQFSQLQEALLAGQFTLTTPLHAVCEAISHYHCDILLVTGRPTCLPGVQALIRHLQPVPVNRIVWMDKYQVHEWYPFSQQGRIGNPKSTAAVGAMLCSLALDLRLPRFNFKAADIGAYSTVRYLGVLDNTVNTLRDENIWYHEIDLDKPGATLDARLHFPLRGNVTLGFRQLANSRWPATPLYCLSINSAELAKTIAGDGVLNVRLKLRGSSKDSAPESFILSDAWLQDGTPVAADALTLKLNTLADRRHSGSHYWIDSGSVYLK
ncbi:TPA: virulence factor SrfB [Salmonella enterica]|nr:virulence factor SrfB [Salmonella enterica]